MYVVHQQLISCWRMGDCSTRVRLFLVLFHKRLGPDVQSYTFPAPVYDELRHPVGLDIALPDRDVPRKYILKGGPTQYLDMALPGPGTLHLVARFGDAVGPPSWPHKCHSWLSLPSTQLTTNGGSRRLMLGHVLGGEIKQTRLTAPVETVRIASLPQSYLSYVRGYSRNDGFLHQCVSQSKDEEVGNYQRFSSNLHLFLQRGGGKFNYNLHRTILHSTILTLESGFLTLNERDRHSTHKNTSFSWRQPSYVILFHRNMEMEKWNIVKLDDKWSTFCHVQFHFSFFFFLLRKCLYWKCCVLFRCTIVSGNCTVPPTISQLQIFFVGI